MLEFAKTPMGKKFFNHDLPELIKALQEIPDNIEKNVENLIMAMNHLKITIDRNTNLG
jgi:hypothetical protein